MYTFPLAPPVEDQKNIKENSFHFWQEENFFLSAFSLMFI